jgi:hypothetical protein
MPIRHLTRQRMHRIKAISSARQERHPRPISRNTRATRFRCRKTKVCAKISGNTAREIRTYKAQTSVIPIVEIVVSAYEENARNISVCSYHSSTNVIT